MLTAREELLAAMFAGDHDELERLAPCVCCCHEHTFVNCEARQWGGCRSGLGPGERFPEDDYPGWLDHYVRFHGLTEAQFRGDDR